MSNSPSPTQLWTANTIIDTTDPTNHKLVIPLADLEPHLTGISTATLSQDIWDKAHAVIALLPYLNGTVGASEDEFPELAFFIRYARLSNDLTRKADQNQRDDVYEFHLYSVLGNPDFNNLV